MHSPLACAQLPVASFVAPPRTIAELDEAHRRLILKDANGKPVELAVTTEPESPKFAADTRIGERRYSGRNRLALPIRIRCKTQAFQCDEITLTENVSLTGLYFSSMENYLVGTQLQVTYPYWTDPGGINREYPARVARLDRLPDGSAGIAIEFLQDLRER
jgi:hypothetical protein